MLGIKISYFKFLKDEKENKNILHGLQPKFMHFIRNKKNNFQF